MIFILRGLKDEPVICCHVCDKPIDHASSGAAVWRIGIPGQLFVYHVHQGTCFDAVVKKLGGKECIRWSTLCAHLKELVGNCGMGEE